MGKLTSEERILETIVDLMKGGVSSIKQGMGKDLQKNESTKLKRSIRLLKYYENKIFGGNRTIVYDAVERKYQLIIIDETIQSKSKGVFLKSQERMVFLLLELREKGFVCKSKFTKEHDISLKTFKVMIKHLKNYIFELFNYSKIITFKRSMNKYVLENF